MTRRYAMVGQASREALSYCGLILTHTDRAELEFLFRGVRVVELGDQVPEYDCMPIAQHPDLSRVRWPLQREDFI
jgi:hypothetical protein